MSHRTRVVLAGWIAFSAVFFATGVTIPDSTDVLPLLVATTVTVLLTPVLHAQLARYADDADPVDS